MAACSAEADAEPQPRAPVPADVARRAVQWFVDLQGPAVSAAVRDAWLDWRSADPEHERAWLRIEAVSGRMQLAAPAVTAAVAQGMLDAEARGRRRRVLKALGIVLLGAGGASLILRSTSWREMMADHRTAIGERRTLTLADGSVVMLDTASAITVRFTATERRIVLVSGRIQVTSARDRVGSARPLLVETHHGEALALGTRFTVRQDPSGSVVAVYDGIVEVRPWGEGRPASLLRAGERTRFSRSAIETPGPIERGAPAWTQGAIVAVSMRLDDFLAELGRYSTEPIVCDPRVAGRRLSGAYPVDDRDVVLETLAGVLGLEVRTVTRLFGGRSIEVRPAATTAQGRDRG